MNIFMKRACMYITDIDSTAVLCSIRGLMHICQVCKFTGSIASYNIMAY